MSERRVNGKQWRPYKLFFYHAQDLACLLSKSFLSSPVANIPWIQKRLKDCLPSTS